MITLEEAKRAYKSRTPVLYHAPMAIRPLVCTIGDLEFSEKYGLIKKLSLKQSSNSFIIARPQDVSLADSRKEHSPELEEALAELGRLKEEGFIDENE